MRDDRLIELSVELAKAHLASTPVETGQLTTLVREIYASLAALSNIADAANRDDAASDVAGDRDGSAVSGGMPSVINADVSGAEFEGLDPWLAARVSPRILRQLDKSSPIHPTVHPDYLVCLEDGEKVKLLRAYLRKKFGLTFSDYVNRWNLPENYPTAPPNYLKAKRALAKATGLGVTLRGTRGAERAASNQPRRKPAAAAKNSA